MATPDSIAHEKHLRLVWPQWQGAGSSSIHEFSAGFSLAAIRRGYAVGTEVLQAVLPAHHGPTEVVPVEMGDRGLDERDGIEAKWIVLEQLRSALDLIAAHAPERITTLGGDCSVSMAPFSWLAGKYGDDLAIVWIDSHPDTSTGASEYHGYHAMVVSGLTGHGDEELLGTLPSTVPGSRVALVGTHDWSDESPTTAQEWGLTVFAPDALRDTSDALLRWIRGTGASKVAVHFDVDTIDAAEARLGLGEDFGGLTIAQARRVVADIEQATDVVALTVAEYVPRQVIHLQQLLAGFPLLGD